MTLSVCDQTRGRIGRCDLPPKIDDWTTHPVPSGGDFEVAVNEIRAIVQKVNDACAEYLKTGDTGPYNTARANYSGEIQKVLDSHPALGLEWPTLLWNGQFIHVVIVQQPDTHTGHFGPLNKHSSSSLGWP